MKPKIFISYQRSDSASAAGRLFDNFLNKIDRQYLFKDVDSILIGQNFEEEIVKAINDCTIFLIVIGKKFNSEQQLLKSNNYVRIEIETAIKCEKPIIPVFIDEGYMPDENTLPTTIKHISKINGAFLRNESWGNDFELLFSELEKIFTLEHRKVLKSFGIELLNDTTGVFTDIRDQSEYNIIKLGDLWWFSENLKYDLPEVNEQYNSINRFYTIKQTAQAIPDGWRLPNKKEYSELILESPNIISKLNFSSTGFYDSVKGIIHQNDLGYYWSSAEYKNDGWFWYLSYNNFNQNFNLSIVDGSKYLMCRCVISDLSFY